MFAKGFIFRAVLIFSLTACTPPSFAHFFPTVTPGPDPTPTPAPLELQKIETFPDECSDMIEGLPGDGLTEVAYLPSGYCFHGELDVFETGGRVYVAQAIMSSYPSAREAFRIIDVTDAEHPTLVGAWKWNAPTFSADIKAFRQGDRWFLALSRDPNFSRGAVERLCSQVGGVAIIEVTEPANPKLIRVLTGENTGSDKKWCNAHTSEVSRDADGNGAYLYVAAVDVFDLRVLDIRDLEHVVEAGHHTHPDAGNFQKDLNNFVVVHDTAIVGDRVYVANWSAGLIILDRRALEAGKPVTPLNPLDSIDPSRFLVHFAYPTTDGNFVFIEDELRPTRSESHLRLYDIRDVQSPKEVAGITLPDSWGSPHNLVVSGDLLFVGWYQDGVRVF